jgi:hypothetical protein
MQDRIAPNQRLEYPLFKYAALLYAAPALPTTIEGVASPRVLRYWVFILRLLSTLVRLGFDGMAFITIL